jgi:hypothetical protein
MRSIEPGIQGFPDVQLHLRSGPEPVIGRRKAPTRWDHPGMTKFDFVASLLERDDFSSNRHPALSFV